MKYQLRLTMIVSDADRAEANLIATEITSNPADVATYSVPLSADGSEPATHWCCSTVATEAMGRAMTDRIGRVPSVRFFTQSAQPGAEFLIFSNVPAAASESLMQGGAYTLYTFERMLEKVGLQRVQPAMEDTSNEAD